MVDKCCLTFDYGNLRRHYAGLRRHYVDLRHQYADLRRHIFRQISQTSRSTYEAQEHNSKFGVECFITLFQGALKHENKL